MPQSFRRVSIPAVPEIWTWEDAMERLISGGQLQRGGRNWSLMMDAVRDAYRDLPKYHQWTYYQRSSAISTQASYVTGTVAYTASTRRLTLTDGTWPENAAYGAVKIGDSVWDAWNRVSDTILELDPDFSPPSDIAAGTKYEWFRDSYQLPSLTRKLGRLKGAGGDLAYVDPQYGQSLYRSRNITSTSSPSVYTIRSDKRYLNSLSIVFIPPPSTAVSYTFHEHPGGQLLTTEKLSTGTVAVDGSPTPTTNVTFSSGVLDASKHLGCVLRLSANGVHEPTTDRGSDSGKLVNPYAIQRIIVAVTSPTVCVVDSAIAADYSAVKYTISSPLDINYNSMLSLFWSLVSWEFKKNTFADGKEIGQAEYRFKADLKFAMAEDNLSLASETIHRRPSFGYGDWCSYWYPIGS